MNPTFRKELEANRFTVAKILEHAHNGLLRIPPFQRPLRWTRSDHLLFLDSLYRGYPVGTLLLWQKRAEAGTVWFGRIRIDADSAEGAYWIVDGQQRITSLVACLLLPFDDPRTNASEFSFSFDLEDERFIPSRDAVGRDCIPVGIFRDSVTTSMRARETNASIELHRKAEQIGHRIRNYEIPVYVTHSESDTALREIFARANTGGKRMRSTEVFEALNRGLNPDDTPGGLIERLQAALHSVGFGIVSQKTLQKALVSVAGYNPKENIPVELSTPGAATRFESLTTDSILRTVEFLREEAAIPHAQTLPYDLPLIILPRFFAIFRKPSERSLELLVRWVWRGVAHEVMANNAQFNLYFRAWEQGSEDHTVQNFISLIPRSKPASLPESGILNLRGMRTKVEFCAMYSLRPRSFFTVEPFQPSDIFERDSSKLQSRGQLALPMLPDTDVGARGPIRAIDLQPLPGTSKEQMKQVHSRILHPPLGLQATEVVRAFMKVEQSVLDSHGIDCDTRRLISENRADHALDRRRERIKNEVESLFATHARWSEDDDGPSLYAGLLDDET